MYRWPSAVIVLPENDEADVTPVGGADPVTVGLCAEDLGEGAILHNRLQQASEVGDLELVGAEAAAILVVRGLGSPPVRSEEHTSELQSLMRISYAVFCLQKKKTRLTYNQRSTHS